MSDLNAQDGYKKLLAYANAAGGLRIEIRFPDPERGDYEEEIDFCLSREDMLRLGAIIASALADEAPGEYAAGRVAGLREAAAWHALKAAHYERQVHDTFGKGEFHTDAARAILALAEGKEG